MELLSNKIAKHGDLATKKELAAVENKYLMLIA